MAESKRQGPQVGHFSEEQWVDFAREQHGEEQRARQQRHLDAGCVACAETLRLWRSVLGLAGQEADYHPPDETIRRAKGQFSVQRPKGLLERAARGASLVFDSFRQPLPAGVRAAGASPRQLLYKAGRYAIRLQVEPGADSNRLFVVGQILDEGGLKTLHDLPVLLLSGEETADRTLTNTLGEFQLQSDPSENLRLSIGVPKVGPVTVPVQIAGRRGRGDAGTPEGSGRRTKARHARVPRA